MRFARRYAGALDGGYVDWNSYRVMTFVSNHDSDPPQYQKTAYAYVLTQEGYPRVYQKDMPYWDDDIQNLLWIRRNLAGGPSITRHASADLYVFEREGTLLTGLNRSSSWQGQWVQTSWSNPELNDYAGNNGDNFTTDGNGWVQIWIPPQGWVCCAPVWFASVRLRLGRVRPNCDCCCVVRSSLFSELRSSATRRRERAPRGVSCGS